MDAKCAVPKVATERSGNLRRPLSTAERFPCKAPSININQHCELLEFLPKDYQYHVCKYKAVNQSSDDHISFEAVVRMSLKSKEQILVWLKSMAVTWRVAHTRPTKRHRIIFKADYRCQHNTKPRETLKAGRVSKNTDCPAKLKVTLVRTEVSKGQLSRNTDPHIPDYPTIVDINNIHNHRIQEVDAMRHQDVDVANKTVEKLKKLLEAGHSPSSALDVLKYDLQVQRKDDCTSADHSVCPDLLFCHRSSITEMICCSESRRHPVLLFFTENEQKGRRPQNQQKLTSTPKRVLRVYCSGATTWL